jgi:hypothetical protein
MDDRHSDPPTPAVSRGNETHTLGCCTAQCTAKPDEGWQKLVSYHAALLDIVSITPWLTTVKLM